MDGCMEGQIEGQLVPRQMHRWASTDPSFLLECGLGWLPQVPTLGIGPALSSRLRSSVLFYKMRSFLIPGWPGPLLLP